ncbi:MAG: DUF929 family protein [Candidatus Dormibacteraeota bacterium]|nr:DUF929 family protein [Candidatus Dormibacteraeota bacterium]
MLIIMIVVAMFVAISRSQTQGQPNGQRATATIVRHATAVSPGVYDSVGGGSAHNLLKPTNQAAMLRGPNGKPELVYVGAEWCPYCAAERWSLVVALSRFGSFGNLGQTSSASSDAFPNTPTFSFHNATYRSSVLDFVPVETQNRNRQPLESPTSNEQQLMKRYDPDGSIPFVLIGGRMAESGSGYQPDALSGHSMDEIASNLDNPSAASTQAIVGDANVLSAAICQLTSGRPGDVCQSASVQRALAQHA